ncbi:uncharacterized protein PFL1_03968 [Pseudozyma flocculosa PF-1]|uniref:FCP1 homology domain-containing protein n=2 Tax=Pseudozyma flocculosa TaxID=84751 RepID=A0A5C3EWI9_9BASI|nr:uncharacterized protein PFL1_03968 [Pseudozyma flocculosa PF-1]EPQ28665.1 hypothetical protein PFL1_03968 [Pseudozyma flocculosa PF-1]SPO36614.1 uncharacterized protein PSFLO_02085 [Pseudozyma flocculosa]
MDTADPAPEPALAVIEGGGSGPAGAASSSQPDDSLAYVSFAVKYSGSMLSVRLGEDDCVADLKAILYSLTDVPPASQKLLGITRGKPPSDDTLVGSIPFAPSALKPRPQNAPGQPQEPAGPAATDKVQVSFMLLGTPEADRFQDPSGTIKFAEDLEDRLAGDIDYAQQQEAVKTAVPPDQDPKNLRKLEKVIARFSNFSVMNEPRAGKRLLVLDLDYTIADTKRLLDPASPASVAARPGLHDFLAAAYRDYDICVWSQTSWRWLEVKLIELGMIGHDQFNISFVLDRTPMFSITAPGGKKHEVKPLELIWRRWPDLYGPHNTIHVDDLSRNGAINPKNICKIRAYKDAPRFDTELQAVLKLLRQLAHPSITDFRDVDLKAWKHFQGAEKQD